MTRLARLAPGPWVSVISTSSAQRGPKVPASPGLGIRQKAKSRRHHDSGCQLLFSLGASTFRAKTSTGSPPPCPRSHIPLPPPLSFIPRRRGTKIERNPGIERGSGTGSRRPDGAVSDRHESQKAAQLSCLACCQLLGRRGVAWSGVDPCRWKWGFDRSWQRRLKRDGPGSTPDKVTPLCAWGPLAVTSSRPLSHFHHGQDLQQCR